MWSKIINTLKSHTTNKPQPAIPEDSATFFDRLNRSPKPAFWIPPSIRSSSLNSRPSRPTVGEIFSFLNTGGSANNLEASLSLSKPALVPGHDSTNPFDISQQLDMSSFPSPGPDFDIAPTFLQDSSVNGHSKFISDHGDNYSSLMSSTRYQPKDLKGKGNAIENEESREDVQATAPKVVQEAIIHTKEKSPKPPPSHHERSQSFNLVPTVFYSVANSGTKADKTLPDNVIVASSTKHMSASSESQRAPPTSTSAKTRSRSMSNIMLHSSFSQSRSSPADINDESTTGIVVYSGGTPEHDPFGAHANTYYTPQTMIPPTPPKEPLKHARKTSKEENQIISSQTQLTPQTELCHLCGRCEVDLKSRDELIGILNKKLADLEKDDTKRKDALRSWKKKTQELERVCRQLEETIEDSRQESMGRSVIDEASNEALRMLHRQIAGLHREKNKWLNREQGLREGVETLESLVEGRKGMGWEQTAALEKQNADLTAERDALRADVEELKARTSARAVERNESENKENELTTELQEMRNLKDGLEKERDELKDALQQSQEQAAQLDHDLQERDSRVSELEREGRFAKDNVSRLERNLRARDAEISQVAQQRDSEVDNLHEEMSTIKREYTHLINEQTKALRDAAGQEDESKARMDQLVRTKAEADVEIKTSRERIIVLNEEIEHLRRLVHSLQLKSADKEVKTVRMTKQHSFDKEGLDIALDSKQQDLELLKRKTAGSTPAQPSKVTHRRDPSISTAIPVLSRSSSVLSDSGIDAMHVPKSERMISSEMAPPLAKLQALGKSRQVNGSVMRAGINGSIMGPPSLISRPSIVGNPTPSAKGLSTNAFLPKPAITTSTFSRKGSSVNSEHRVTTKIPRVAVASTAPSVLEQDEKENVGDPPFKPETKHDTHTPLINHASRFIVPN